MAQMDVTEIEDVFEEFEVEHNGEYCWSDELTLGQFLKVVRAMGWANVREFTDETGCEYDDIKGKHWMVCGNPSRIFIV